VDERNTDWNEGLSVMSGSLRWGLMQATPETARFWEGVEREELWIKCCASCHEYNHPKRIMCARCFGLELRWIAASGMGSIFSFSTVPPSRSEGAAAPARTLGIVVLEENVPLFVQIESGVDSAPAIGQQGRMTFATVNGRKLPVFLTQSDA
jgi:uncharacterized protein